MMFWRKSWKIIANYIFPLAFGVVIIVFFIITLPDVTYETIPSLVVALLAALLAAISVSLTSRSLELTRNTQRPFLNVTYITDVWSRNEGKSSTINYFVISLCNTGSFPADKLSIKCDISFKDKTESLKLRGEAPIRCFPNDEISNLTFEGATGEHAIEVEVGGSLKVKVEIYYYNKLNKKHHKTIRSYSATYNPEAHYAPKPLSEHDYWD